MRVERDELGRVATPEAAASLVARRWEKVRAERAAAGESTALARPTRFLPAGSDVEYRWVAKGIELGVINEDMTRTLARRIAKKLYDEHTKVAIRRARDAAGAAALPLDDDLLLDYLRNEAAQMRARARRDREIANEHDRHADEAEGALVAHMRRLGIDK